MIICLFVLQVISASFCYDIQLQGMVKIGEDLLDALHLASPISDNSGEQVQMFRARDDEDKVIKNKKKRDLLKKLLNHFQRRGTQKLNESAQVIMNDLKIERILSPTMEIVTNNYAEALKSYYDFLKKHQNDTIYQDKDAVYLDFADTSCTLLFNEEKKLLNDVIMHENHIDKSSRFEAIDNELLHFDNKYKIEAIRYVCYACDVCREYPDFTDYISEVINETLSLDDTKFDTVLNILSGVLKQYEEAFTKVMEKEDIELIKERLQWFPKNLFIMKDFLNQLRTALTQRFKIVSIGSKEFKINSKASQILMGIINKGMSQQDDVLGIDFDNVLQAIKHWAITGGKNMNLEKIFERFVKSSIRRLQYNWTKNARNEIKVLMKTIMRGNMKDDKDFQSLFKFGSSYVKGEDFHPDIESMTV